MSEEATLDEFTEQQQDGSTGNEELREDGFLTLPRDWKVSTLDEVAKEGGLVDGDWIESADMDEDGEIQLVQLGHIGQGQFKGEPNRFITEGFAEEENCTVLSEGDLLISRMQEPILRSCLLPSFDRDSVMAVDIARLQETEDWNRQFLKYVLNSRPIWKQGIAWASGTTRKRISRKNMEKLRLPTPSLSEQRKIATMLHTIDRAIEKTKEIVKQTEIIKKGIFQNFISEGYFDYEDFKTIRLGGKKVQIPEEWTKKVLSQYTNKITDYVANGSFADIKKNVEYKDEEDYAILLRLVDYSNNFEGDFVYISEDAYNYLSKSKVNPGDIILSNIGANLGTVFKAPELGKPMNIGPNALLLKSNFENDFLYHWLDSDIGQKTLTSIVGRTAQKQFSKTNVRELEIPVPPLHEQEKISGVMSHFDRHISKNNDIRSQLRKIKQGLMQDLLTGTVRTADINIEVPEKIAKYG